VYLNLGFTPGKCNEFENLNTTTMFLLKLKLLKIIGSVLMVPIIAFQFSGFFQEVGAGIGHIFKMVTLAGYTTNTVSLDYKPPFEPPLRSAIAMPGHWHLRERGSLAVHYKVYSVSGGLVFEHKYITVQPGWVWAQWNGKTFDGEWAKKGNYCYTVHYVDKQGTVTHRGEFRKTW
jgi:hypothetical protein